MAEHAMGMEAFHSTACTHWHNARMVCVPGVSMGQSAFWKEVVHGTCVY